MNTKWIGLIVLLTLLPMVGQSQYEHIRISGSFGPASRAEILTLISRQYDVRFAFDPDQLQQPVVQFTFKENSLDEVMKRILDNSGFSYSLIRSTVVIVPVQDQGESPPAVQLSWSAVISDAETGETLPFAVAALRGGNPAAIADGEGRVFLQGIPADTCHIVVRYVGYDEQIFPFSATAGKAQTVALKPRNNVLEPAVVVGRTADLLEVSDKPGVQAFNPADISLLSTNGEVDVLRGAQLLPGVSGTTENSNGLIIRGSDPDQALVMFDDFTVFHVDHFYGSFSAINPDAVKQVRVYKGGMDSWMGGRVGGLVRITGKEGNRNNAHARISLSSLSASLFVESPIGKSGSAFIAARRSYINLISTPVFRNLYTTIYRQGLTDPEESEIFSGGKSPEFFYQDLIAKYTWRGNNGNKINVSGYLGRDDLSHQFRVDRLSDGISSSYADQSRWGNSGVGLRWTREKTPGYSSLVAVGLSSYDSRYFSADTITNSISGLTRSFYRNENFQLTDFTWRAHRRIEKSAATWVFGINSSTTGIRDQYFVDGNDVTRKEGSSTVIAGYGQSTISKRGFSATPGFRINYYDRLRSLYPEWRFSTNYTVNKQWQLKGTVSRIHQFLHRIRTQSLNLNSPDLWLLSGDANLPVLRSDQFTLGFKWERKKWMVDAEGFLKKNEGTFEYLDRYSSQTVGDDSLAFGSGRAFGADVLISFESGRNHIWVAYSWMNSANKFAALGDSWIPEWFDQRHEFKCYYEIEFKQLEFALNWMIASGRPYTPLLGIYQIPLQDGNSLDSPVYGGINSARLSGYHRMDASVTWNFSWGKAHNSIALSVFNVYNHKNVRDIRYAGFALESGLVVSEQKVQMLGIVPSLQLQIQW